MQSLKEIEKIIHGEKFLIEYDSGPKKKLEVASVFPSPNYSYAKAHKVSDRNLAWGIRLLQCFQVLIFCLVLL